MRNIESKMQKEDTVPKLETTSLKKMLSFQICCHFQQKNNFALLKIRIPESKYMLFFLSMMSFSEKRKHFVRMNTIC